MSYGRCLATIHCTYNSNLSKNARLATRRGHFYVKDEAKAAEKTLHHEISLATKGLDFKQAKVYIDITVYKPHVNADAINFIDTIADVLKVVIGVDDRWFSIKKLDWHLDRTNPRIIVKLYQEKKSSE